MKVSALAALAIFTMVSSTTPAWAILEYAFDPILVPGSTSSQCIAINNFGTVVGNYEDGSGHHGFVLNGGTYTALDVPGATSTAIGGLNDGGSIVGSYVDSGGATHGFLWSGGVFATIDASGADNTALTGINNAGQILGNIKPNDLGFFGSASFVYTGGSFDFFQVYSPFPRQEALDINDSGGIVGWYLDPYGIGEPAGFIKDGSLVSTVYFPSSFITWIRGISDAGTYVGQYNDIGPGPPLHGFVYAGGSTFTLDYPGSAASYAEDINDSGHIVGNFDGHGYLASPIPEPSTFLLGLLGAAGLAARRFKQRGSM